MSKKYKKFDLEDPSSYFHNEKRRNIFEKAYKVQYELSKSTQFEDYYHSTNASKQYYNYNNLSQTLGINKKTLLIDNIKNTINHISPRINLIKSSGDQSKYYENNLYLQKKSIKSIIKETREINNNSTLNRSAKSNPKTIGSENYKNSNYTKEKRVNYKLPQIEEIENINKSINSTIKNSEQKSLKNKLLKSKTENSNMRYEGYNSDKNNKRNPYNQLLNPQSDSRDDTIGNYVTRKVFEINPSIRKSYTNKILSFEYKADKSPIYYSNTGQNKMNEGNFTTINVWWLNYNDNYTKYSKMARIDVIRALREIVSSKELLTSEVAPIFDLMDSDGSGFIDFKEYKMFRFLIDGMTNSLQLKREFRQLDNSTAGKITKGAFIELFKVYIHDCILILEHDAYR